MRKKSWIALLLGLVLIVSIGSMVFAQDGGGNGEPGECTVTISVVDTDGNLVSSPASFGKEAWVEVEWDEWWAHGNRESTSKLTEDGAADFTLKKHTHYDVRVLIDIDGHHYWGLSGFHTGDDAAMDITVCVLRDHEVDVNFHVSGPVGLQLHFDEDYPDRSIPMGATEFDPIRFRVEVFNFDGDATDVTITAFTMDGDWHGNLVWTDPLGVGQIGLKFSADLGEENWGTLGYMSQDGENLTAVRPGDVGHLEGKFLVKGYVGESTMDKHGRIIFRAELVN